MAVFRVEKTKDFTIMCNHHLRNRKLKREKENITQKHRIGWIGWMRQTLTVISL